MLRLNDDFGTNGMDVYDKTNEWFVQVREQFEELNQHIIKAITDKNFTRSIELDSVRQDILRELCLIDPALINEEFFSFIEHCAQENAALISKVEDDMEILTYQTSKQMRMQAAYLR